jgi:hypothetical protein
MAKIETLKAMQKIPGRLRQHGVLIFAKAKTFVMPRYKTGKINF